MAVVGGSRRLVRAESCRRRRAGAWDCCPGGSTGRCAAGSPAMFAGGPMPEAAVAVGQVGLQFQVQFQPLPAVPASLAAATGRPGAPHQFQVHFQLLGGVNPLEAVDPEGVPGVPDVAPLTGATSVTLIPPVGPFVCTVAPSSPGLSTRTITTSLLEVPVAGGVGGVLVPVGGAAAAGTGDDDPSGARSRRAQRHRWGQPGAPQLQGAQRFGWKKSAAAQRAGLRRPAKPSPSAEQPPLAEVPSPAPRALRPATAAQQIPPAVHGPPHWVRWPPDPRRALAPGDRDRDIVGRRGDRARGQREHKKRQKRHGSDLPARTSPKFHHNQFPIGNVPIRL